ncbi:MAG: FtsQ-type POTRA domain-containing protein [Bryobacteraceae bacterium]|nr:FtsQ-type POTRA domain-containing protein [Bryobacteraceae bacterium]
MARRKAKETPEDPQRSAALRRALTAAGWSITAVCALAAAAFFLLEWNRFLARDPRFRLPEEDRAGTGGVFVEGVRHVPRAAVLRVFEADRGRGIHEIDLEKRREELRRIDWVRDAAVRRVWPCTLFVRITEREPVALIQVPAGISGSFGEPLRMRPMLIDEDGVLLPMNGAVSGSLPLLIGVRREQDVEHRRRLVRLMLRVLEELAPARPNIPEVDVTDPENVRVAYQTKDHLVVLILGNEKYLERLNVFLSHLEGIQDRLSHRAVLDLTTEGRITLVGVPPEEQR